MHDTVLRSIARLQALGHQVESSKDGFLVQNSLYPEMCPEVVTPDLLGLYLRIAEVEAMARQARVVVTESGLSYAE